VSAMGRPYTLVKARGQNVGDSRRALQEPEEVISPQIPSSVTQAIVNAHYPRMMTQPDSARNRAQAAFAIASAIATTLVGFSVFGGIKTFALPVQILGILALLAWVVTAALYINAVAAPIEQAGLKESKTVYDFANAVLSNSLAERKEIDTRQKRARRTGAIAAVLTFATLIGAFYYQPDPVFTKVDVIVSDRALEAFHKMCTNHPAILRGRIEKGALEKSTVAIKLDPNQCRPGEVTATFRREELLGVATR
jgi:hypothetical protein